MRPIATRPTYSDHSSDVTIICSGASGSTSGPGIFCEHQVQQRLDRSRARRRIVRGIAFAAAGVDVREVEGQFVGPQLDEQVEHFRQDFAGPAVGTVDLVDHDDRLQADFERLLDDVAGLRTRPLEGVDQDQAPSAIDSTRSTSPPKSAWPGVSMMLTFTPW